VAETKYSQPERKTVMIATEWSEMLWWGLASLFVVIIWFICFVVHEDRKMKEKGHNITGSAYSEGPVEPKDK
jgi:hypothetical protein